MAHGGRRLTYRLAAAQGRCTPPGHHPVECQSYVCLRSYPVGPLGRSCHHHHGEPLHDRALVTEGAQFIAVCRSSKWSKHVTTSCGSRIPTTFVRQWVENPPLHAARRS